MAFETDPLQWSPDARDMENMRLLRDAELAVDRLYASARRLSEAATARNNAEVEARNTINALPEHQRVQYQQKILALSGLVPVKVLPTAYPDAFSHWDVD